MKRRRSIYESMTKLSVGAETVRIWRAEKNPLLVDNRDLRALAPRLSACRTKLAMLHLLRRQPRVSAVEVLSRDGTGLLVYNDWP